MPKGDALRALPSHRVCGVTGTEWEGRCSVRAHSVKRFKVAQGLEVSGHDERPKGDVSKSPPKYLLTGINQPSKQSCKLGGYP